MGLKAPRREGTGLRNTRERLRYLYPDEHRFELGPRDAAAERAPGVRVVLDLPARDLSLDDEPLFAPWPPVAPEARAPRIEGAARGGADA